nr:hypothetical protein [Tanacetum cinerariifolium]
MHILVILSLVLRVNDLDEELEEENADYANEPEEEDPEEEDPEEEDPKEEESNDNAASEEEPLEGFDDTELSKEDKTAVTPPPSRLRGARISIHPQTPMPPLYEAQVAELLAMDTPPPSPLTPIESLVAARPTRVLYSFVDNTEAEASITRRHGRTLHDTERRMMTTVELVNLRVSYKAQTCQRDGEEYEARNESLEAHNRSLVARIETIETRMTEIEDQFQDTRDYAVSHVMHTQALEARAQIDTMEDAGSSC